MAANNLFTDIPEQLPQELFETLLEGSGRLRLERIVSQGHTSDDGEWYDQPWGEWVVLLSGSACLEFADGRQQALRPGDYLWLPAHCRHRVAATDATQRSVWLALHLEGEATQR